MHDQIGVAPDRAREMQVVWLGQSIMSQWLRSVTSAFQTFQQTDLESLLFRFYANRSEQSLQIRPLRYIANLKVKTEHHRPILRQLLRIGIFVDAIDSRNGAILQ